jgi:hypothetical protein
MKAHNRLTRCKNGRGNKLGFVPPFMLDTVQGAPMDG